MRAVVLLLAMVLFLSACAKRNEPSPPQAAPSGPARSEAPSPASDDTVAKLAELTQAVRRFGLEQRRRPQSLDELVSNGYLSSVPEAPAGKKFVIDSNLQVVLADK